MAVTFDANSNDAANSVTSTSWCHTVAACTCNRFLVVFTWTACGDNVTSVTYNCACLTQVPCALVQNGAEGDAWYMTAPATGTNTVTVNIAASCALRTGAHSYYCVCQTTPFSNVTTASACSQTPSITVGSAANNMVVDHVGTSGGHTETVGACQTQRINAARFVTSDEPGAACVTMSWSFAACEQWHQIGMNLNAVSGCCPTTRQYGLPVLGVS